MKINKSKKFLAIILAITVILSLIPGAIVSAGQVSGFPLIAGTGDLVADDKTKFVTIFKQDPATKLITATIQIQHNTPGAPNLVFTAIAIEISFNENLVAPHAYYTTYLDSLNIARRDLDNVNANYDPNLLFSGLNYLDRLEFTKYCKEFYSTFAMYGNQYIKRNGTGGVISTKIGVADNLNPMVVKAGEPVDIIEVYFMPVNGTDIIDFDMFGYEYSYDLDSGASRNSPYILNGLERLEAIGSNIPFSYNYLINPGSFKMHMERPLNISADNVGRVINGYDPDIMMWSYDGVTYNSGMPVVKDEAHTIYVRGLGDDGYKRKDGIFSDAMYVNYKMYLPSDAQVTFLPNSGVTTYTVTFYNNDGTTDKQERIVEEGTAIGASNMPTVSRSGYTFEEWNTDQDGNGDTFTALTEVTSDLDVYAQWSVTSVTYHTVTFYNNDGTTDKQELEVEHGTAVGASNMPTVTRGGYSFVSWNTAQNGTGSTFTGDITVTDDISVYAQWAVDSGAITVTFNPYGGTLTGATSKSVYLGQPYGELPGTTGDWIISRAGGLGFRFDFDGWFPTEYGGMTNRVYDTTTVTNANNHMLYARWLRVTEFSTVFVRFDSSGGKFMDIAGEPDIYTHELEENTAVGDDMPSNPVRADGHTFVGWNTIRDGTGSPFTALTLVPVNISVYAQYTPPLQYCKVTFDSNYSGSVDQEVIVEKDKTVGDEMPEPPERSGYTFDGWYTRADGTGSEFTSITPVPVDIRVYAKWIGGPPPPTYYTVTFNSNGGVPTTPPTRNVLEGTAIGASNMPAAPTLSGFEFIGWNTEEDGSGDPFTAATTVNEDITVFAQYEEEILPPVKYTVTFDFQDGVTTEATREVEEGMTLGSDMPGAPGRAGYTFIGWNTDPDGSGDDFTATTEINDDITVYGQWEEDDEPVTKYTVTFNGNGGTPATNYREVEEGKTVGAGNMPVNPTWTGYTFVEWNTSQNGSGDRFTASTEVNEDITVYAQWNEIVLPTKYTVRFNSNYGTPVTLATREVNSGATIGAGNMPGIPTRTGYEFNGWNTAQNGSGTAFTGSTPVTSDITVYAQWKTSGGNNGGTYYTVTFDGNGGAPASQTRSVLSGGSIGATNMPGNLARSGYTFAGWNTKQDGTGTAFTHTTTVSGNIRVYAQWTSDTTINDPRIPTGFTEDHIAYIRGYPDNSVKPDNSITRAEVAMIFFRLLVDENKNIPKPSVFSDVVSGAWYAQAISYLASINILKGYPDGKFRPNQPITRAEFATIASRFDQLEASASNAFPDIATHWAKAFINSAAEKGWVEGYPDGTFQPQKNISRAEVVKVINVMLDRKIQMDDIPVGIRYFTDLAGHWAYTHIVEASNEHDYQRKSDGYEIWTLK